MLSLIFSLEIPLKNQIIMAILAQSSLPPENQVKSKNEIHGYYE
jgi:hypothetical protein